MRSCHYLQISYVEKQCCLLRIAQKGWENKWFASTDRSVFSFQKKVFAFQTVGLRFSRDCISIFVKGKLTAAPKHRKWIHRLQFLFKSGREAIASVAISLTVKVPGLEVPKSVYDYIDGHNATSCSIYGGVFGIILLLSVQTGVIKEEQLRTFFYPSIHQGCTPAPVLFTAMPTCISRVLEIQWAKHAFSQLIHVVHTLET